MANQAIPVTPFQFFLPNSGISGFRDFTPRGNPVVETPVAVEVEEGTAETDPKVSSAQESVSQSGFPGQTEIPFVESEEKNASAEKEITTPPVTVPSTPTSSRDKKTGKPVQPATV